MAAKKNAPAMDFILDALKKNKDVSYAEVLDAAKKRNFKIYPIMYGRAKALLGLVPVAPRGQGRKASVAAPSATRGPGRPPLVGKRGPGRPRTNATASVDSLDAVISALKDGDRERDRYRRALEQIRVILENLI